MNILMIKTKSWVLQKGEQIDKTLARLRKIREKKKERRERNSHTNEIKRIRDL